jgi:hypothetical protein
MESTEELKLELINKKKLYNPFTKEEFNFEDLYKNLEPNQISFFIFFRRWG